MEFLCRLKDVRRILQGNDNDAVGVRHDDIAGVDAYPSAGDGDIDLAGSLLVGVEPVA